jgi:hypothetical protein
MPKFFERTILRIILSTFIFLVGCSTVSNTNTPTATVTITPTIPRPPTKTSIPSSTHSPHPTGTFTPTMTATVTEIMPPTKTATITVTPTITPTLPPPEGVVSVAQANCRYGPGWAYLYKYGLYQDFPVELLARTDRADWVYVLPKWYESGCWIRADLLEITGDVLSLEVDYGDIPYSFIYPPPHIINVTRRGDEVTIEWADVGMTEDKYRGYLIEAWLCLDGKLEFTAVNVDGTITWLTDEYGCSEPSSARIFSAEKHGYSKWRIIPWPVHEPTSTPMP